MALNYEKTHNISTLFFRNSGRENRNSKMIALPFPYSSSFFQKYVFEKGILEKVKWSMKK